MAGEPVAQGAPVSRARVENCLKSATFWVNELPRYADRQQQKADTFAIGAGILAAVTSLSIFPVLDADAQWYEKAAVTIAAFLASVLALIPRIKNYAELAGQARELSSRYGGIVGDLLDLAKADPLPDVAARAVVTEFEGIKENKDNLRGLPDREEAEIRRLDTARRLAEAQARTDSARNAAAEARN